MERFVALNILWLLMFLQTIGIGQGSGFDCINECFGEISDALRETDITCEMLQRAQSCHDNNTEACDRANAQQLGFHLHSVQVKQRERNCTVPVVTIATTAPIPPAEVTCPVVPDQVPATPNTVAAADIAPEGTIPTSCQVRGTGPVSHCSLFLHSHLRPFHFLMDSKTIQTCSLPGAWKLFHHRDLVIDVEGTAEELNSMHTRLTKVRVTFPGSRSSCNPTTRSYTAHHSSPLPSTFACSTSESHNNTDSPLQLHRSEDGSAVSLLATWLNSSIIIRQMDGFLAVTVKVTGDMAFESEGLCTGCPSHQYVDSQSYSDSATLTQNCLNQKNDAVTSCFSFVVLLSDELQAVTNITYFQACTYSLLRANSSHVRRMTDSVAEDAILLRDGGPIPRPLQVAPAAPALTSLPSSNTCHTETVLDDITTETVLDDITTETVLDDITTETVLDDITTETVVDDITTETVVDDITIETVIDDITTETVLDDITTETVLEIDITEAASPTQLSLSISEIPNTPSDPKAPVGLSGAVTNHLPVPTVSILLLCIYLVTQHI